MTAMPDTHFTFLTNAVVKVATAVTLENLEESPAL
jgi:hypothetical protein